LNNVQLQRKFDRLSYKTGVFVGASRQISIDGIEGELAVEAFNKVFILPGTRLAEFMLKCLDFVEEKKTDEVALACAGLFAVIRDLLGKPVRNLTVPELRKKVADVVRTTIPDEFVDVEGLAEVCAEVDVFASFDPHAWVRPGTQ